MLSSPNPLERLTTNISQHTEVVRTVPDAPH
jgi:hypothetical protein